MEIWVFVIILVAVTTCGKVVTEAIHAYKERGLPSLDEGRDGVDRKELGRLRDELETLAGQVERLQEEQRFLTRLLEERPPPAAIDSEARTEDAHRA